MVRGGTGMDPYPSFATRDDLWQLQNDMKSVHATQAEQTERILRLERRQDEDTRVKSVWGNTSPFPSILGGTPQHDPGYNPAAEAFKNFDQDQSSNLLGSLHLYTEDEPRRGTSRANSVRFDESALSGHFAHASRSSSDFFPLRTGSGLGGHPMTERSSSHKSDGRQSAASHSNPASRLNSLAFDSRPSILASSTPIGPPPGLSILGPLPSIIRCWLDTKFSNESLLYAALCTGSYSSVLSSRLVDQLGLKYRLTHSQGEGRIKIQVHLPEATIQQSSSRSISPAPQLPSLTVDFFVQEFPNNIDSIQILLGSDILRARNADVLFSQERLTIFDDDRNKIAVPLVRPENPAAFQDLLTVPCQAGSTGGTLGLLRETEEVATKRALSLHEAQLETHRIMPKSPVQRESEGDQSACGVYSPITTSSKQPSAIGEGRRSLTLQENEDSESSTQVESQTSDFESVVDGTTPETPSRTDIGNTWGSWRRDSIQHTRPEGLFSGVTSNAGYQRASRGRGMKVLKPARSSAAPSRSTSTTQVPLGSESAIRRAFEAGARADTPSTTETIGTQAPGQPGRSLSGEAKSPLQLSTKKTRPANPIGGASAFGWLNAQQKQPSAPVE